MTSGMRMESGKVIDTVANELQDKYKTNDGWNEAVFTEQEYYTLRDIATTLKSDEDISQLNVNVLVSIENEVCIEESKDNYILSEETHRHFIEILNILCNEQYKESI